MKKEKLPDRINVGVFYTEDEVGVITLDEDSMNEEFETRLEDLQELVAKLNRIK